MKYIYILYNFLKSRMLLKEAVFVKTFILTFVFVKTFEA